MSLRTMFTTPLTPAQAARVKWHLALLPVYAWLVFAWSAFAIDNSVPGMIDRSGHNKGHDFAHFYVLGQIGADRSANELYSFDAQAARLDRLFPSYRSRFLPVHPPQVAVFFAPLARFPYATAWTMWLSVSAMVFAWCCWALVRSEPVLRRWVWWPILPLCLGFPALHAVIAAGQTSIFALGWFTLGWLALSRDRPFLAGLALGALAYKPSLLIVAGVVLACSGELAVIAGAVVSGLVQAGVAWAWFGTGVFRAFVNNSRGVGGQIHLLEAQPLQMHSLRSFFTLLLPSASLAWMAYAVSAALIVLVAWRAWRSAGRLELRYAVLILATLLVDPHVYSYELIVLTCAFFLIGAWMLGRDERHPVWLVLLGIAYLAPTLENVARYTHLQITVPALAILTVLTARRATAPVTKFDNPLQD